MCKRRRISPTFRRRWLALPEETLNLHTLSRMKTRHSQLAENNWGEYPSLPCFPLLCWLGYIRYDFSADFPKLWCEANIRGGQGERKAQYRRKRRSSTTKRVANVYLRFVSAWQARRCLMVDFFSVASHRTVLDSYILRVRFPSPSPALQAQTEATLRCPLGSEIMVSRRCVHRWRRGEQRKGQPIIKRCNPSGPLR